MMAMNSNCMAGPLQGISIFHREADPRARMPWPARMSGSPVRNFSRRDAWRQSVLVPARLAMNLYELAGPFQKSTNFRPMSDTSRRSGPENVSVSSSTKMMSWSSVALFLGGALLASGFGLLPLCKPAFAEVAATPEQATTSTTLNDQEEVKVEESTQKHDDVDSQEASESSEGRAPAAVKPDGEGSELAGDPVEVLLNSYLEVNPNDKKALQALLFSRLKKGEVDASLSVLTKLIELEPENLDWKYMQAQTHDYAGNLDEARRGFEEILQSRPLSARAMQGLAHIMQRTGEIEEALQMLAEAVKKAVSENQPKEASNLRMLLGQMHTVQGNLETALELYQTVAQDDPKDYRPYLCQGLVYSIIGQQKEAEKQFRQYRTLCPQDFHHRGLLDELMLSAKSEARKMNKRRKEAEERQRKGRKPRKDMRPPLATGSTGPRKE